MSNTKLRNATYCIDQMIRHLSIQSYTTRADTRLMLIRCIKDLHELGFKVGHLKGIKERHVEALVAHWKTQDKSPETIKNYMSKLRTVSRYFGSDSMLSANNSHYQIENRPNVPVVNKAITDVDFSRCTDPYIRLSLEGQALFGFRREESLKFTLSQAHVGDVLSIKPSWTKGGIGRTIKIRTNEQREWLSRVHQLVKRGESLIPADKTYKQHLSTYQTQVSAMGLHKCHGLRHAYAQKRYRELTAHFDKNKKGLIPPIQGGKSYKELSPVEKKIDQRARHILSLELGHTRASITKIYC